MQHNNQYALLLGDFRKQLAGLACLLLFLLQSVPAAQTAEGAPEENKSVFGTIRSDITDFYHDGLSLARQPGRWDKNDWVKLAAIGGTTALLMTIDQDVDDMVSRNPGYDNSFPVQFGKWTGEPVTTAALTAGFYLYGLAADDSEFRQIGFEIGESAIYSGMITGILKYSLGRWRPYKKNGPATYSPLRLGSNDYLSLPSGHSALAFSLATVLSSHTDNNWLKALFYAPAILTTASRVYHHQHWTSDVFLGASIGYIVGKFVTGRHKKDDGVLPQIGVGMGENQMIFFSIPL